MSNIDKPAFARPSWPSAIGGALKISGTDDAIFCDRASYQKGL